MDAILRRTPARVLLAWEAYAAVEPFDETRADYRAASIATMIANVNRGRGRQAYKLEDFVLRFGQQAKKRQTPEEMLAVAKMWAVALGGDPEKLRHLTIVKKAA